MKRRVVTVLFCLVYLGVALFLGICHNHHESSALDAQKSCVACAWNINGVADVPVVVTAVAVQPLQFTVPSIKVALLDANFVPSTASRAPPFASA